MYVGLVFIDLYSEIRESRVYIFPTECPGFPSMPLLSYLVSSKPNISRSSSWFRPEKMSRKKKGAKRTSPRGDLIKREKNNYIACKKGGYAAPQPGKKAGQEKSHRNRKGTREGGQMGSGGGWSGRTEDETSARAKVYFGYDLAEASEPPSVRGECSSEHSEEEYSQDGFIYRRLWNRRPFHLLVLRQNKLEVFFF